MTTRGTIVVVLNTAEHQTSFCFLSAGYVGDSFDNSAFKENKLHFSSTWAPVVLIDSNERVRHNV